MKIRDRVRQNLRKFREEKGLTQAEMAEKLSITPTNYAKWERGEVGISLERLPKIARVLEVNEEELLRNEFEGILVFNTSNDSSNNSSNFNVAVGDKALEAQTLSFSTILELKDMIINSQEREIDALKAQIEVQQRLIAALEKSKSD